MFWLRESLPWFLMPDSSFCPLSLSTAKSFHTLSLLCNSNNHVTCFGTGIHESIAMASGQALSDPWLISLQHFFILPFLLSFSKVPKLVQEDTHVTDVISSNTCHDDEEDDEAQSYPHINTQIVRDGGKDEGSLLENHTTTSTTTTTEHVGTLLLPKSSRPTSHSSAATNTS